MEGVTEKKKTSTHRSDENTRLKKEPSPRIVSIEEAPEFLIDNKFLIKGYRKDFRSCKSIIKSLAMAHNETLNTWTHLLGSLGCFWILYYILSVHLPHDSIVNHLRDLHQSDLDIARKLDVLKSNLSNCDMPSLSQNIVETPDILAPYHLICRYLQSAESLSFELHALESSLDLHNLDKVSSLTTLAKDLRDSLLRIVDKVSLTSASFGLPAC